jgi:predicted ribosome quality control (RQC) complex YloA/Tae2 family protein
MPLDAFFLSQTLPELREKLLGARVDKIQQPEKDVLLLHLRGSPGGPRRLLLSAGSGSARVHITTRERENPAEPPMFCMLLRKHLTGGRLLRLEQPEGDRVLLFTFACLDELGEPSEKQLAAELMGRNANLVLIDAQGRVLDCLHKADPMAAPKRPLLPGLFYALPPAQEKENLFSLSEDGFMTAFRESAGGKSGDRWLVETFSGVSPLLARELMLRASGGVDTRLEEGMAGPLWAALAALREESARPVLLLEGEEPRDFYCRTLRQYGSMLSQREFPSFSELLDEFYTERERLAHQKQRSQSLLKLVKNRRERAARKLAARTAERKETEKRETWRQYGDLIKANLYRMERGDALLRAENFYDPENAVTEIPLDVRLSPQKNAERYYKLYSKAKNAEKVLTEQIAEAERELDYLESVREELERAAGERDLMEIRQELIGQGYLRETDRRRKKSGPPRPLVYESPSGGRILVGRNNLQNDWLTLKTAERNDFWFHTQKIHGSHVIAQCPEEDRETLAAAALLAAWYSGARDSAQVPVDYTRVRFVKKPAGARPGMVIYTDQKTLFITPEKRAVEALKLKK